MAPSEKYNSSVRDAAGATPAAFLTALWGSPPPGRVLVWTLPDKRSHWYAHFDDIDRDMRSHIHKNVYTGVGIAPKEGLQLTPHKRLVECLVAGIPAIWADLDVTHPIHRKAEKLPPTREAVLEALKELPMEPTLVIDSGHGLQCWWILDEPWLFADADEREQARRATQWWHRMIQEIFAKQDWVVDSTFDLARVMRLPGTTNNKDPEDRREVTILEDRQHRHNRERFLELVPPDFVASPPVAEQVATGRPGAGPPGRGSEGATAYPSDLTIVSDAQPNPVRLGALLKAAPKFQLTWARQRSDLRDRSASGYNMSIACYAVRAGWPDQEVVNAMIYWRCLHSEDPKVRGSYYARTLVKAKRFVAQNRSDRPTVDSTSSTSQGEERGKERRLEVHLTADEGLNIEACVSAVKLLNDPPILLSISDGKDIGVLTSAEGKIEMEYCVAARTHLEVTRRLRFTKVSRRGEAPVTPSVTLMNLVHRALPQELPRFNGFKRLPFLWGKSLVTNPGYHAESGYYLDAPDGLDLTLPVSVALQIINEYLGEFPFQGPADKANAFSVILGCPLKALGNAPGLFVDKPQSQTGATLLCRCLGAVIEGNDPLLVTQGKSVGEFDKRAVAALKEHPTVVIFDNLNGLLDSDMAASGMTDAFFGGRLLGGNDFIRIPTRSLVLMFTANNLIATRELQNRCLRCRLDANDPSPETRTNFRHRLPEAVLTNRVAIVSAVSSIAQRWVEAGSPQGSPVLGSYIDYTRAVSGLLKFVGLDHLDGNRRQMITDVTPSWESLDTLVLRWWEKHDDNPVRAVELLEFAEELDLKGFDDRSRAASLSRRLGHALNKVWEVGDRVHVKLLESGRDEKGRAKHGLRYRLLLLKV